MRQRESGQVRGGRASESGAPEAGERVGLVLSGAAARGPYQAGALAELFPALLAGDQRPVVLLGTSSGGINAALLAQFADQQAAAGQRVVDTWVGFGEVFKNPLLTLPKGFGPMLARFLGVESVPPGDALLDTAPLRERAKEVFKPDDVAKNITGELVDSLAVAATLCPSGRSAARSRLFVQGAIPDTGQMRENAVDVVPVDELDVTHLLASAAVPVLFPPEYVAVPPAQRGYYIDGGVRLNAPVDAALAMGVTRLVVIAGHSVVPPPAPPPVDPGSPPPDIASTTAIAVRAVLADALGDDLQALGRHNKWDQDTRGVVPPDQLPYRRVPYLLVAPKDGELAGLASTFRPSLTDPYLAICRLLDAIGGGIGRDELLSLILFSPDYARKLVALGREHARTAMGIEDGGSRIPESSWQYGPPRPAA